ncbi:MAG: hypothetical protein LBM59_02940 [Ruminococcus sp.]|jgi:hypothetical protein|nr:hypothetical protein [Ruminococcus sp.]
MATANEILSLYISQYYRMLTEIDLYDRDNPDSIAGHNVLVKIAGEYRSQASAAGYTELPPLPEKK